MQRISMFLMVGIVIIHGVGGAAESGGLERDISSGGERAAVATLEGRPLNKQEYDAVVRAMHFVITTGEQRDRDKDLLEMKKLEMESPRAIRVLCNLNFFTLSFPGQKKNYPNDPIVQFMVEFMERDKANAGGH